MRPSRSIYWRAAKHVAEHGGTCCGAILTCKGVAECDHLKNWVRGDYSTLNVFYDSVHSLGEFSRMFRPTMREAGYKHAINSDDAGKVRKSVPWWGKELPDCGHHISFAFTEEDQNARVIALLLMAYMHTEHMDLMLNSPMLTGADSR